MSALTSRDRELVALGAAMGSNCVSCVEYHIPESRRVGLSDPEIHEAIQHADKIRQVPARKTLQAALKLLPSAADDARSARTGEDCGSRTATEAAKVETNKATPPGDAMMGMVSKMMDICGGRGQSVSVPTSTERKPTDTPASTEGCSCG